MHDIESVVLHLITNYSVDIFERFRNSCVPAAFIAHSVSRFFLPGATPEELAQQEQCAQQ